MGFTYNEAYRLPLWQRKWFIERLNKEFTKSSESGDQVMSRAAHANSPEQRAMSGMSRTHSPSRLRRFT